MKYKILICSFLITFPAHAIDPSLKGHFKYQPSMTYFDDDSLAAENSNYQAGHQIDARLVAEATEGNYRFESHAELLTLAGKRYAKQALANSQFSLLNSRNNSLNDKTRIMGLSVELIDEQYFHSQLRLDRLNATYLSEYFVTKVGRQAISWGNGVAFHVFDFINPFSPVDVDKDYKTGEDQAYLQALTPWGDDLQAIAVGRRDAETNSIRSNESSYALKWRGDLNALGFEYDILAARHYTDNIYGLGMRRSIFDAVIRLDLALTELQDGTNYLNLIANIDRSWLLFEKNVYAFIEYFRNNLGAKDILLITSNPALISRIERGELYSLGRDLLAIGGRIELTPRTNLFQTVLINLHDESGFYQVRCEFDWLTNLSLQVGLSTPWGKTNTEFGGLEIPGNSALIKTGTEAFVRLSYFY